MQWEADMFFQSRRWRLGFETSRAKGGEHRALHTEGRERKGGLGRRTMLGCLGLW
jgi:hypothetical protein